MENDTQSNAEAMGKPVVTVEDAHYSTQLKAFWDGLQQANDAANAVLADLPEVVAFWEIDEVLSSGVFAAMLMRLLGGSDGMDMQSKRYWMEVANEMGPDYIQQFKHVGGFMSKVDEF